MLTDHHIGWIKEFLIERCLTEEDKESADDIVDSFRKLWRAVDAGKRFRDLRSNESLEEFCVTLDALKNL